MSLSTLQELKQIISVTIFRYMCNVCNFVQANASYMSGRSAQAAGWVSQQEMC